MAARKLRYGAVALGSTVADWLTFALLDLLGLPTLMLQIVARVAGGLFSFLVNRSWTFSASDGGVSAQGRRYLILYAFSYLLSVGLFAAFTKTDLASPYVAKLVADGTCFFVNYVVMQEYVYHRRDGIVAKMRRIAGR